MENDQKKARKKEKKKERKRERKKRKESERGFESEEGSPRVMKGEERELLGGDPFVELLATTQRSFRSDSQRSCE